MKIRKNAFGQVEAKESERTWIRIVEVDKNCQHRVFGIREVVEVLGNTREFKLSRQSDKLVKIILFDCILFKVHALKNTREPDGWGRQSPPSGA